MKIFGTQISFGPDTAKEYFITNAWIILALFVVSNAAFIVLRATQSEFVGFLALRFMHDDEYSLPTLYNFALIITNYALILMAFVQSQTSSRRTGVFWGGLAGVFVLLAYDEAAQLHEKMIPALQNLVPDSAIFYYAWTPIGGLFALAVGCASIPYLIRLPKQGALLMVLSGVVYLSGALGLETVGGMLDFNYGRQTLYFVSTTFEESLEMLGMTIFGSSVLTLLTTQDA